jgi:glycosyltransferase involved in cell wall biosynthesis
VSHHNEVKISIVLCTHNGERFLPTQLDSFLAQTRLPNELVVCDDCSSDATPAILRDFAERAPFTVRIYNNESKLGIRLNFQKGIELASGDILVFSDQDDQWLSNKLELIERAFTDPDVGIVFSNAVVADENLNPKGFDLWTARGFDSPLRKQILADSKPDILRIMIRNPIFTGMTMAFHARYKQDVLPIGSHWWSDGWVGTIVPLISRVALIETPLANYRQHDSASGGPPPMFSDDPKMAVANALESSQHYYDRKVNPWLTLRQRLLTLASVPGRDALLSLLDGYIAHSAVRATLPKSRPQRLPKALRELMALNYHEYSSGWLSFFKDMTVSR